MFSIWSIYANVPAKCLNVGESGGEVRCAKELRINADFELDVLLVLGGEGVYCEMEHDKPIEFVRNKAAQCRYLFLVRNGTFHPHKSWPVKEGATRRTGPP